LPKIYPSSEAQRSREEFSVSDKLSALGLVWVLAKVQVGGFKRITILDRFKSFDPGSNQSIFPTSLRSLSKAGSRQAFGPESVEGLE